MDKESDPRRKDSIAWDSEPADDDSFEIGIHGLDADTLAELEGQLENIELDHDANHRHEAAVAVLDQSPKSSGQQAQHGYITTNATSGSLDSGYYQEDPDTQLVEPDEPLSQLSVEQLIQLVRSKDEIISSLVDENLSLQQQEPARSIESNGRTAGHGDQRDENRSAHISEEEARRFREIYENHLLQLEEESKALEFQISALTMSNQALEQASNISDSETKRMMEQVDSLESKIELLNQTIMDISTQNMELKQRNQSMIEELQREEKRVAEIADSFEQEKDKTLDTMDALESEKERCAKLEQELAAERTRASDTADALHKEVERSLALGDELEQERAKIQELTRALEAKGDTIQADPAGSTQVVAELNNQLQLERSQNAQLRADLDNFQARFAEIEEELRRESATAIHLGQELEIEKDVSSGLVDDLNAEKVKVAAREEELAVEQEKLTRLQADLEGEKAKLARMTEDFNAETNKTRELVEQLQREKEILVETISEESKAEKAKSGELWEQLLREKQIVSSLESQLDELRAQMQQVVQDLDDQEDEGAKLHEQVLAGTGRIEELTRLAEEQSAELDTTRSAWEAAEQNAKELTHLLQEERNKMTALMETAGLKDEHQAQQVRIQELEILLEDRSKQLSSAVSESESLKETLEETLRCLQEERDHIAALRDQIAEFDDMKKHLEEETLRLVEEERAKVVQLTDRLVHADDTAQLLEEERNKVAALTDKLAHAERLEQQIEELSLLLDEERNRAACLIDTHESESIKSSALLQEECDKVTKLTESLASSTDVKQQLDQAVKLLQEEGDKVFELTMQVSESASKYQAFEEESLALLQAERDKTADLASKLANLERSEQSAYDLSTELQYERDKVADLTAKLADLDHAKQVADDLSAELLEEQNKVAEMTMKLADMDKTNKQIAIDLLAELQEERFRVSELNLKVADLERAKQDVDRLSVELQQERAKVVELSAMLNESSMRHALLETNPVAKSPRSTELDLAQENARLETLLMKQHESHLEQLAQLEKQLVDTIKEKEQVVVSSKSFEMAMVSANEQREDALCSLQLAQDEIRKYVNKLYELENRMIEQGTSVDGFLIDSGLATRHESYHGSASTNSPHAANHQDYAAADELLNFVSSGLSSSRFQDPDSSAGTEQQRIRELEESYAKLQKDYNELLVVLSDVDQATEQY